MDNTETTDMAQLVAAQEETNRLQKEILKAVRESNDLLHEQLAANRQERLVRFLLHRHRYPRRFYIPDCGATEHEWHSAWLTAQAYSPKLARPPEEAAAKAKAEATRTRIANTKLFRVDAIYDHGEQRWRALGSD